LVKKENKESSAVNTITVIALKIPLAIVLDVIIQLVLMIGKKLANK
jgi:hypothetical protein